MSEILCQMFLDKFPPVGINKAPRVLVYDGQGCPPWEPGMRMIERIHLQLHDQEIHDRNKDRVDLITPLEINKVASKVFDDVHYEFSESGGDGGPSIRFSPEIMSDYNMRYNRHDITVQEPFTYPKIMFSIGNRGTMDLHERQRQKYFQFAVDIYETFLKNARKL